MKKIYLSLAIVLSGINYAAAQRVCGTMEHLEHIQAQHPEVLSRTQQIENQTQSAITNQTYNRSVVTIPVVFHVVYRNSTQNISDAQIASQMTVLNKDFRNINSDASLVPAAFASLVADAEINFCMATQTPTGASFNGINRVSSTRTSSFGTNDAVKSASTGGVAGWDPNRYLNIWVCEIGGGILGYATFPGTATSTTDGVVIDYNYLGTTGTATAPFNKGRTATHEIGHWLNLRHIWGDATCGSDLVNDTPTHNTSNYGCPSYPHYSTCSGSPIEMTMNYMDYTDDACMYMFSAGQKARMQALFGSGGARVALLTSTACGGASAPTCSDGIQNGTETGIDCGGSCTPCPQPTACLTYCASKGNSTADEYIGSVTLGSYTNASGNNGGYASYGTTASYAQGSSISFSITRSWTGTIYSEYSRIWADWNADGDFDDSGELVYDQGATSTTATLSGSFTVPANASLGNTTFRVTMKYNAAPSTCETFSYGEVEDYCVSITASQAQVCTTTSGLSASSIATTSAILNWSAVSGASSYNVQYKPSSSSTWTSTTSTTNSKAISGLSASTSYDFQVQTVCSFGNAVYSTPSSFLTATAPTTCTDNYEANESRTAGKTIPVNTNISAVIGTSTDKDWFKFSNTSSQKNIRVTLSNLPADYDLQLYKGSTKVGTSQNGGTTNESLIYNTTKTATTYYAYVYGYGGVYDASSCYTLRVDLSSTALARIAGETEASDEIESNEVVSVYPNPSNGSITIRLIPEGDINQPIEVYNHLGQLVDRIQVSFSKDHPATEIRLNNLADGMYYIRVFDGNIYQSKRVLIKK
jgi:hypothetical protein